MIEIKPTLNGTYCRIIHVDHPNNNIGIISPSDGELSVKEWLFEQIHPNNFTWEEGCGRHGGRGFIFHTSNHIDFSSTIQFLIDWCRDKRFSLRLETDCHSQQKPVKSSKKQPAKKLIETNLEEVKQSFIDLNKGLDGLKNNNVIRSQRFIGEIGEWIAEQLFPGYLRAAGTSNKGWDLKDQNGDRLQIKTHAKSSDNNFHYTPIGNNTDFDYLVIIVLNETFQLRKCYKVPVVNVKDLIVNKHINWEKLEKNGYRFGFEEILKEKNLDYLIENRELNTPSLLLLADGAVIPTEGRNLLR